MVTSVFSFPKYQPISGRDPINHQLSSINQLASMEQLWGELAKVIAPVDPGVAAGRLLVNRVETMFFEHLHGGLGVVQQKIFLAGAEPQERKALLELGVVEFGGVAFFPGRIKASSCNGGRSVCCSRDGVRPATGTPKPEQP